MELICEFDLERKGVSPSEWGMRQKVETESKLEREGMFVK